MLKACVQIVIILEEDKRSRGIVHILINFINDDGNKIQENSGGDNLELVEEEPVENNEEIKDKKGKKGTGRHSKKNK